MKIIVTTTDKSNAMPAPSTHLLPLFLIIWLLVACRAPAANTPTAAEIQPVTVAVATVPEMTAAPPTTTPATTSLPAPTATAGQEASATPEPTREPTSENATAPATAAASATATIAANHLEWPETWSTPAGQIAFTFIDPTYAVTGTLGTADIYLVNADGSGRTRLTTDPEDDMMPAWSPDGRRIAFASDRDGNLELYLMNADGSEQRRLTDHPGEDRYAVWSPDGTHLAYRSEQDGNYDVYLLNLETGALTRLTDDPSLDTPLAWSPDGTLIAYSAQSFSDGTNAIYTVNPDSNEQVTLVPPIPDNLSTPGWSPDGTRFAFTRGSTLILARPDGSAPREIPLPAEPAALELYDWSPDGQWLVAAAGVSEQRLYLLRADGAVILPLTGAETPGYDMFPDWAPAVP